MIAAMTAILAGGCVFAFSRKLRHFHWFIAFTMIFEGLYMMLHGVLSSDFLSFNLPLYVLYTLMMLLSPFLYYFATRFLFRQKAVGGKDFWMAEVALVFSVVLLMVVPQIPVADRAVFTAVFSGRQSVPDSFSTGAGVMMALDTTAYLIFLAEQLFTQIFCVVALYSYYRTLSRYYSNFSDKSIALVTAIVALVALRFVVLFAGLFFSLAAEPAWFETVRTVVFCLFYALLSFASCRVGYTAEELSAIIAAQSSRHCSPAADELIGARLNQLIADRFYVDPDTDLISISDSMQINYKYVAAYLKNHYGETFLSFTNRLRIEYAAELIGEGSEALSDISLKCGYLTDSTFYRNFLKVKGISPSEYKKNR